ncbi:MAG: hypothetical protein AAGI17_08695 [Planctomycetota bacterium]
MKTLRHYHSALDAQSAALHLIENGVLAGVVQDGLGKGELYPGVSLSPMGSGGGAQFRVVLADKSDAEAARLLLDEFDALPVELDADWESQAEAFGEDGEPGDEPEGHVGHGGIEISDELLKVLPLRCHGCQYALDDLLPAGRCPKCGRDYDKRALLAHLLDPGRA